ncbi:MAG: HAD-IA family hydrolase [Nakamurella sp.]
MPAILFGSISTVADTSELQRDSFNQSFEIHGLDWRWDRDQYRAMLAQSGGASRIAAYADSLGQSVDARAIHETKSEIFRDLLLTAELSPRAGVVETIRGAKDNQWKVGLVTTTSGDNVLSLLAALSPEIGMLDFDVIVNASTVEQPKPDKAAYSFALKNISEEPGDCVAIEDNVDGVRAAVAAGLACVAFPNENTADHDFAAAVGRVDRLDVEELQQFAGK